MEFALSLGQLQQPLPVLAVHEVSSPLGQELQQAAQVVLSNGLQRAGSKNVTSSSSSSSSSMDGGGMHAWSQSAGNSVTADLPNSSSSSNSSDRKNKTASTVHARPGRLPSQAEPGCQQHSNLQAPGISKESLHAAPQCVPGAAAAQLAASCLADAGVCLAAGPLLVRSFVQVGATRVHVCEGRGVGKVGASFD
eukprot:scaffold112202_cov19-Tisochrysis_lutea.AAC.2